MFYTENVGTISNQKLTPTRTLNTRGEQDRYKEMELYSLASFRRFQIKKICETDLVLFNQYLPCSRLSILPVLPSRDEAPLAQPQTHRAFDNFPKQQVSIFQPLIQTH